MPRDGRVYDQRELVYLAVSRIAAIPLFLGLLLVSGEEIDAVLAALIIAAVPYCFATLWLALSDFWNRVDPWWLVVTDLLLLSTVLIADGGPESEVSVIFLVWTVAMAMIFQPRQVLYCAIAAMSIYALASFRFVLEGPGLNEPDLRALGVVELALAWAAMVTFFVSNSFARRRSRITALSEARQRLLADALSAEERARRRLSQSLHDDTLQVLLAVGQDLSTGLHGDTRMLVRAREELRQAVRDLRETIRGLHPAALEHGGLAGGLDAVVERAARYGGFEADLRVDPEASSVHDSLVVSVIRELVTNAAKHSEATRLEVTVVRDGRKLVCEVIDDGKGMTDTARDTALAAGHIGLASIAERIDAAGGKLRLDSSPQTGTRVRIELPLPPRGGDGSHLRSENGAATVAGWPETGDGDGMGSSGQSARSPAPSSPEETS